jgi:predicted ATP-dependent endonuclease of OLD family
MKTRFPLALGSLLALALVVPATPVVADEGLDSLIQTLRSDLGQRRDSALSTLVELNGDKKKAFWDLTKAYDEEHRKITEQRVALIKEWGKIYTDLTPEQARDIVERAFDLNDARTELKRKYFRKIADEVSAVAAAQFVQLQTQFEVMADAKLSVNVPLAGF